MLPAGLLRALEHVFAKDPGEVMLVGGTALAGFYAGHRRSDDLDLFARHEFDQRATVLAVRSLTEAGADLLAVRQSAQYFQASLQLAGHRFTVDVVLDPRLFEVGSRHRLDDGVQVAALDTLLCTKAATLVSRCSEKDLFDILWLTTCADLTIHDLIARGQQIDAGLDQESLLVSLTGSALSVQACGFGIAPEQTPQRIFEQVSALKNELLRSLSLELHRKPVPPLGKAVSMIRRWRKQSKRE